MGILDLFRSKKAEAEQAARPQASAGTMFAGLDDPNLLEFMRGGQTDSGAYVTPMKALNNMAVMRSVSLISQAIGMLPLSLYRDDDKREKAADHPVHKLLSDMPNGWQSSYDFKTTMQMRALLHGNAYALVVRTLGRPVRLVPVPTSSVTPKMTDQLELVYEHTRTDGGKKIYSVSEMFHLRDISEDGISGLSRVKLAQEAIGLALQAEKAAARLFRNGMMVGGALTHPGTLSTEAYERLQNSMQERYSGSANAHKWMVLEEGMSAAQFSQTASDSQHIENRNHQIEEVARAFGVPRPLLAMDDTSWGSGIEQLGLYFVQYTLAPWFKAWEESIERTLLTPAEREQYYPKFNERALLRGSMKDQAEFFAKALGAGGTRPWMTTNEVRGLSELPLSDDPGANSLSNPMTQQDATTAGSAGLQSA